MVRLADEIAITIAGERIVLRPSLRCAMRLERRPGSFAKLIEEIGSGSLTAAVEIIGAHHRHPLLPQQVLDAGLVLLRDPLERYVLACAGLDLDEPPEPSSTGTTVTFREHLLHLYRIGTGWLGWSPDTTLDATPAEISEAYKGRLEMLCAIFGGADDKPAGKTEKTSLADKFKSTFAGFGTVKVKRSKKAA